MSNMSQELVNWYHELEAEWQEKVSRLTAEELHWWLKEQDEEPVTWEDYVKLANANVEVLS